MYQGISQNGQGLSDDCMASSSLIEWHGLIASSSYIESHGLAVLILSDMD